jgi:hypothetical protein
MKKVALLIPMLCLFLSFNAHAQKAKAKKIAKEMTEVLSLDKKESKAIYKIQLNRFKESALIKSEHANEPVIRKQKLKKLGNEVYNQLKAVLGIVRLKKWKQHRKH